MPNISECSGPTLTYFYAFGRRISGDDFPNIRFAAAQGTLLWQPVKWGDVLKRRVGPSFLFASAFDNGLADRKFAFKIFNCNNQATLCPN